MSETSGSAASANPVELIRKQDSKIRVKIRMSDGSSELVYQIKYNASFKRLFDNFCERHDLDFETVKFRYDGTTLSSSEDSPAKYEMKDGDTIEASLKHSGGGFSSNSW